MRTLLLGEPPAEVDARFEQRRASAQDLSDDVRGGEHHMVPATHTRHGDIDQQVAEAVGRAARAAGLRCLGPVNIAEASDDRVPDRCVVGADAPGVHLATAVAMVEIVSPDDETFARMPFYFERGVHEVLVVDPASKAVTWFTRGDRRFVRASGSRVLDRLDSLADRISWPD